MEDQGKEDKSARPIVIVNDDYNVAVLMAKLIEREGWHAEIFDSADHAIEYLKSNPPPALIITDIYMPGMDGWRFCRLLRSPEYNSFQNIPILVVSATFAGDDIEQLTMAMGANAFLTVPLQPVKFLNSVGNLLRSDLPHGAGQTAKPIDDEHAQLRTAEQLLANRTRQLYQQAAVLDQIHDMVTVADMQGNVTYVNDAVCRGLQCLRSAIIGKSLKIFRENPDKGATQKQIIAQTKATGYWRGEIVNITAEGREIILDCRTQLIRNVAGEPVAMCGISTDITKRKLAERRISDALREKETLLRELYHRTKNNMQVICSMLTLQAANSGNPAVIKAFREMESRIQAMALAHQKLYQANDLSSINLNEYLADLMELLVKGSQKPGMEIRLDLNFEPVRALLDTAIPCGLIINELTSNSFKHGFSDGRAGVIRVEMTAPDESLVEIYFSDNGKGTPADFNFHAQKTLGLQIIIAIVEQQMQGTINFSSNGGLSCRIQFHNPPPVPENRSCEDIPDTTN